MTAQEPFPYRVPSTVRSSLVGMETFSPLACSVVSVVVVVVGCSVAVGSGVSVDGVEVCVAVDVGSSVVVEFSAAFSSSVQPARLPVIATPQNSFMVCRLLIDRSIVYGYCVFRRYYYPPHKSDNNCFSTIETVVFLPGVRSVIVGGS